MELKELTEKTCNIFGCEGVEMLGSELMKCALENDESKYTAFCDLVQQDLNVDWLQKIYQYYQADRKVKMQDYTPKCLGELMGRLAGGADKVVDMCAGSGALTIQKWNQNNDQKFEMFEMDENVIPYLLFNLVLRNINALVHQSDVLQQEIFKTYRVYPGEKYGRVEVIKDGNCTYF